MRVRVRIPYILVRACFSVQAAALRSDDVRKLGLACNPLAFPASRVQLLACVEALSMATNCERCLSHTAQAKSRLKRVDAQRKVLSAARKRLDENYPDGGDLVRAMYTWYNGQVDKLNALIRLFNRQVRLRTGPANCQAPQCGKIVDASVAQPLDRERHVSRVQINLHANNP